MQGQVWDATNALVECMRKVGGGTANIPPQLAAKAGSTLEEEHEEVGEFYCDKVFGDLPDISEYANRVHGDQRLWGGAQYRRVKHEIKYATQSDSSSTDSGFNTAADCISFRAAGQPGWLEYSLYGHTKGARLLITSSGDYA